MARNRLTDQQIANAAKAGGWASTSDVATAVAIALAESGGYSDAVSPPNRNGTIDYGLWQVNSVHGYPSGELLTVLGNARAAHTVYTRQGWKAWSVYNSGAYLAFVARGRAVAKGASDTGGQTADEAAASGVVVDGPQSFTNLAKMLTDPHTWQRFGVFVLGFIVIVVALFKLTGDNTLSGASKAVIGAAVTRKV